MKRTVIVVLVVPALFFLFGAKLGTIQGVDIITVSKAELALEPTDEPLEPQGSVVFSGSGYADLVAKDNFVFVAAGASMKWAHFTGTSFDNSGNYDPPTGGRAKDIAIAGSTIFMVDTLGVLKYAISPSGSSPNLSFVTAYSDIGIYRPKGVFVYEGSIYVACEDSSKLCVVDTGFTSHTCIDLPNKGQGVFVSGDYIYVVYGTSGTNGGIASYRIADLTLGDTTRVTDAGPTNLWIEGDYAYVTINSSSKFLKAFDISDPTNITYVGRTNETLDGAKDIEVMPTADTLWGYVAVGNSGLAVVNLSVTPPFPVRANFVFSGATAVGCDRHTRKVFVISEDTLRMYEDTMRVLGIKDAEIIADKISLNIYPSPFNASASIDFTLPCNSPVDLSIYDILGRKVANLASGTLPQGRYTFTFNADTLTSGLYIVKLTTPRTSLTKSALFVK